MDHVVMDRRRLHVANRRPRATHAPLPTSPRCVDSRDDSGRGVLRGPRGSVAGSGRFGLDDWPRPELRSSVAAAIRPRAMDLGYGLGWNVSSLHGLPERSASGRPVQFRHCIRTRMARMWYAIEGFDGADVLAQRIAARAAHLARLHALRDAGRLLLAGPCPAIDAEDPGPAGFSGSIVIAEFPSLEDARAWADCRSLCRSGRVPAGRRAAVPPRPCRERPGRQCRADRAHARPAGGGLRAGGAGGHRRQPSARRPCRRARRARAFHGRHRQRSICGTSRRWPGIARSTPRWAT